MWSHCWKDLRKKPFWKETRTKPNRLGQQMPTYHRRLGWLISITDSTWEVKSHHSETHKIPPPKNYQPVKGRDLLVALRFLAQISCFFLGGKTWMIQWWRSDVAVAMLVLHTTGQSFGLSQNSNERIEFGIFFFLRVSYMGVSKNMGKPPKSSIKK